VLSVLSFSAVVLDREDRVLRASDAARAYGLVNGERLMASELLALARQVRRDGEIREGEFEVSVGGRSDGRMTSFACGSPARRDVAVRAWSWCWLRIRPRAAVEEVRRTSSRTSATS